MLENWFRISEVSYSKEFKCETVDNGYTYLSEIMRIVCSETICIASTGSPAELSPSTLSPVNHSLGKLEILLIISLCVMTFLYMYNDMKNESVL